MEFAVYAIAKNEASNVDRFMRSCKACGLPVYVLDTGSTDKTVQKLKAHGAIVKEQRIEPWRYDVARNAALAMVPENVDYVIRLDLDEELQQPAWNEFALALEDKGFNSEGYRLHNLPLLCKDFTRVNHLFQLDASIPDSISYHNCIHLRHGYEWKYAAHEIIVPKEGFTDKLITVDHVLIKHYPPKNRVHTYSKILQAAYDAGERDARMTFMLGRDLYFEKEYHKALEYLSAYVLMDSNDKAERSYAMTLCGKCHRAMDMPVLEFNWMMKAFILCSKRRETCVETAYSALRIKDFVTAHICAQSAMQITEGRHAPNNNPDDWTFKPHEIAMHAAYGLGDVNQALQYGKTALNLAILDSDRVRIQAALTTIGT